MKQDIHPYQRTILRKLMYNKSLRFSDLQIDGMTSKHFNYHLGELKQLGFVVKDGTSYSLTTEGKMYVARLDEANMELERLPKVSVVVYPERINNEGDIEILISRRLKHPNYGKIVGIGGKVRFGETFEEAANRELMEETGLYGPIEFKSIVRKVAVSKETDSSEVVLDILFILFSASNLQGELINKTSDQENFWCKLEDIPQLDNVSESLPRYISKCRSERIENFEDITQIVNY